QTASVALWRVGGERNCAAMGGAETIGREAVAQQGVPVFVYDDRVRIAVTCMLVTAPNLLRG
ncbi:MAG TPA: hypothetical protein VH023_09950, partial [Rhodopila sp.]|nr:hypothetical protein [Rhodopila sp.]